MSIDTDREKDLLAAVKAAQDATEYFKKGAMHELKKRQQGEARALEIAGEAATLTEALDQWEAERVALAELYDENEALGILHRQLDTALTLAKTIIDQIEKDAGMFVTQKTRDKIKQFRELVKNEEKRRAYVSQMIAEATERRNERKNGHGHEKAI